MAGLCCCNHSLGYPGQPGKHEPAVACSATARNDLSVADIDTACPDTLDLRAETVLPGALVPALLDDFGPSGRFYAAQDYRELER